MTPTVTDGATMIAAPAETPQALTAFSSWLNNAMQLHGAQTVAHGADVDADIDADLEGDTGAVAEDELLAIIEQLKGMMSGNQVSATPVGSVASASAATEDDVAAVTAANSTVTEQLLTSCRSNSTAKWSTGRVAQSLPQSRLCQCHQPSQQRQGKLRRLQLRKTLR